jgi:transcriptional regulator with XRE-family HTH domain
MSSSGIVPGRMKLTRLRERRERALLTQRELAEQANISRAALAAIESGQSDPRPGTIRRLAAALNCDPSDLMPPEG